jgi:hypothetical protein
MWKKTSIFPVIHLHFLAESGKIQVAFFENNFLCES